MQMTAKNWRDMGFAFIWIKENEVDRNIFNNKWNKYLDEFGLAYDISDVQKKQQTRERDSIRLDLSTEAPDGVYDVLYRIEDKVGSGSTGTVGVGHGVKVKDGKFVPVPTERAVQEAYKDATGVDMRFVRPGYYWIKEMKYDSYYRHFRVVITY